MVDISIFMVFFAGVASFLSPCVLPLIPVYFSHLSGVGVEEIKGNRKLVLFYNSLFFVLGFTVVFVLMQLVISYFANVAVDYINNIIIYRVLGTIVILLGLHMTGIIKIKKLMREYKINIGLKKGTLFSSFLLGLLFAFGWSPCIGPILGSVLMYASQSDTVGIGTIYLIVYSLGLGLPFLIFSFFIEFLTRLIKQYGKMVRWVEIFGGIILIIMGLILFFNKLDMLTGL
ncbi:MAG: cytochrome c biogenesis CcdA family protein [Fusobacteriota bacterium]